VAAITTMAITVGASSEWAQRWPDGPPANVTAVRSIRSGSTTPATRKRISTFGSRKIQRKRKVTAPRCQASTLDHEDPAAVDTAGRVGLLHLGDLGRRETHVTASTCVVVETPHPDPLLGGAQLLIELDQILGNRS